MDEAVALTESIECVQKLRRTTWCAISAKWAREVDPHAAAAQRRWLRARHDQYRSVDFAHTSRKATI